MQQATSLLLLVLFCYGIAVTYSLCDRGASYPGCILPTPARRLSVGVGATWFDGWDIPSNASSKNISFLLSPSLPGYSGGYTTTCTKRNSSDFCRVMLIFSPVPSSFFGTTVKAALVVNYKGNYTEYIKNNNGTIEWVPIATVVGAPVLYPPKTPKKVAGIPTTTFTLTLTGANLPDPSFADWTTIDFHPTLTFLSTQMAINSEGTEITLGIYLNTNSETYRGPVQASLNLLGVRTPEIVVAELVTPLPDATSYLDCGGNNPSMYAGQSLVCTIIPFNQNHQLKPGNYTPYFSYRLNAGAKGALSQPELQGQLIFFVYTCSQGGNIDTLFIRSLNDNDLNILNSPMRLQTLNNNNYGDGGSELSDTEIVTIVVCAVLGFFALVIVITLLIKKFWRDRQFSYHPLPTN